METGAIHENSNSRLTTEEDWLKSYEQQELDDQQDHTIAQFLNKYVKNGEGMDAVEIGSFPGSFLPTIGRLGYRLNGIDFNPNNETILPRWLATKGCNVGQFVSGDFFSHPFSTGKKYQLVCSFGFIEHFKNFEEVIERHAAMVQPGGQLIITTPNFRGWMQQWPHRFLDKENLGKHYLPSMKPKLWKKQLEGLGFTVQYAGCFGGYAFWYDRNAPRGTIQKKALWVTERVVARLRHLFRFLKTESPAFSAFCGIVAEKN